MDKDINMTDKEYSDYVDKKATNSPMLKHIIMAFLVGGLICVIGQLITNTFMHFGVPKDSATTITTIILIFIGAFLTSINVYSKAFRFSSL